MNAENLIECPITVLTDKAKVTPTDDLSYNWNAPDKKFVKLEFEKAFEIEPVTWGEGLRDCEYKIFDRQFKDLNFVRGKDLKNFFEEKFTGYKLILKTFPNSQQKFLYQREDVPTFDSDDREWDGDKDCVIYFDREIILLSCRSGYKVPRIKIYIGLKKAPTDFKNWLIYIGCPSEKFPAA